MIGELWELGSKELIDDDLDDEIDPLDDEPLVDGELETWCAIRHHVRSKETGEEDRPRSSGVSGRFGAWSWSVAAPHRSTSSARTRSESGTVIPILLATRRLITRSNLVICSTGSSAGRAPFRIR